MTFILDQARLALDGEEAVEVTKQQYALLAMGQTVEVGGRTITPADAPFRIIDAKPVERFIAPALDSNDIMAPTDPGLTVDQGGMGFEFMIPDEQDPATADAAFIYASLSSSPVLLDMQRKVLAELDALGAAYEAQEPERFHVTLLYIDKIDNYQLMDLISHIQFPAAFTVDGLRIGTFKEADDKPVALMLDPDNALLRIQSELYGRAVSMRVPVSEYSIPKNYKPHVTLASDLEPPDQKLPKLERPVRLTIDSIVITRPDYRIARVIRLPTVPGGAAFVVRQEVADMFAPLRRRRRNALASALADVRRTLSEFVGALTNRTPDSPLPLSKPRELTLPELPMPQPGDYVSLGYLPLTMLWDQFGDNAFAEMRQREKTLAKRHYGPGPHPSGSPQTVHAGKDVADALRSLYGEVGPDERRNASWISQKGEFLAYYEDHDQAAREALAQMGLEGGSAMSLVADYGFVRQAFSGDYHVFSVPPELTPEQVDSIVSVMTELKAEREGVVFQFDVVGYNGRTMDSDASMIAGMLDLDPDFWDIGTYEIRHYGPGPHPSGSPQEAHAGDDVAVMDRSEAHKRLTAYMRDNWEEMDHMELAGFMDRDGRMYALPDDADDAVGETHWLSALRALQESGVWSQAKADDARRILSGEMRPVRELVDFGFVQFRPYGVGHVLFMNMLSVEDLTQDQREQIGIEVELAARIGWKVEVHPQANRIGLPDIYDTDTIRRELGLTARHYGPGRHPGTGTPQEEHAGNGETSREPLTKFQKESLSVAAHWALAHYTNRVAEPILAAFEHIPSEEREGKDHTYYSRNRPLGAWAHLPEGTIFHDRVIFSENPLPLETIIDLELAAVSDQAVGHLGREWHDREFGDLGVYAFVDRNDMRGFVVHPGTERLQPPYRATRFDLNGFSGHSYYPTIEAAIGQEFRGMAAYEPAPHLFERIVATEQFQEGVRQTLNRSDIRLALEFRSFFWRHYGPGDHPGTGTPQEEHAGNGSHQGEGVDVKRAIEKMRTFNDETDVEKIPEEASWFAPDGEPMAFGADHQTTAGLTLLDVEGVMYAENRAVRRLIEDYGFIRHSVFQDQHGMYVPSVLSRGQKEQIVAMMDRAKAEKRPAEWYFDRVENGRVDNIPAVDIAMELKLDPDFYDIGQWTIRHYGPGPHPGTGTDQEVHSGDGAAIMDTGEIHDRVAEYMAQNWTEIEHMDIGGFMDQSGQMYGLDEDVDNHYLSAADALEAAGVGESRDPVGRLLSLGFVRFRPYGVGNMVAISILSYDDLTRDQREQLQVEVQLLDDIGWRIEVDQQWPNPGDPDLYDSEGARRKLGLTARHMGPGDHPGTGTPQEAHAGDGATDGSADDGDEIEVDDVTEAEALEEVPVEPLGERPFEAILQDVGSIEEAEPTTYWHEMSSVYAEAYTELERLRSEGRSDEAQALADRIRTKMFLDQLARAEQSAAYRDQTEKEFTDHDTWLQLISAVDAESNPGMHTALLQMAHASDEAWTFAAERAISRGEITPEEARVQGYHRSDGREWIELDRPLYHVTTAASAVAETGLKSRLELGMSRGVGLGGGDDRTISFTEDAAIAEDIERALHEGRMVARNDITFEMMIDNAVTGRDADRPYIDDLMKAYSSTWEQGDWESGRTRPHVIQNIFEGVETRPVSIVKSPEDFRAQYGEEWEPHPEADKIVGGDGTERYNLFVRPADPNEMMDDRFEFYKRYATYRQHAGGPMDPLFFGSDPERLAEIDPAEIKTLVFEPRPGAHGLRTSALGEIRTVGADGLAMVEEIDSYSPEEAERIIRHYGPGPHPGTRTPQEAHAGDGGVRAPKADVGPSELTGPTKTFAQRIAVLKRILTRPQLEIEEADENSIGDLVRALEDRNSWNNPVAYSLAEQALDFYRSESTGDTVAYEDEARWLWEDQVEQLLGDEARYLRGAFENAVEGRSWDQLREQLDLGEEEFAAMGGDEIMARIYREIAQDRLMVEWGMERGHVEHEFDFPITDVEGQAEAFHDAIRERVEQDVPFPTPEEVAEFMGQSPAGNLPEDKSLYLGYDSDGNVQAYLTVEIVDIFDYTRNYSGHDTPGLLGAKLGLNDAQIDDIDEHRKFLHLGLLGARQTGRGYGPEMMLKVLQVANDNNYGIVGESLDTARDFYKELGVRWFADGSPVGYWLPGDVQIAGDFIELAGLGDDLAKRALNEQDIERFTEGFSVWKLGEIKDEPDVIAVTGSQWEARLVSELAKRVVASMVDRGAPVVRGLFRRVKARHFAPTHPGTGTDQSVHAGGRGTSAQKPSASEVVLERSPVKTHKFEDGDDYLPLAREVYNSLDEGVRARIDETRQRIKEGQSTQSIWKDSETGEYPPERVALHEEIISGIMEGKTAPAEGEPTIIMTGGYPGAGKSTVFRQLEAQGQDFGNFVHIDSDAIKSQLPEYEGWNAALTHQEASDIVDQIVERAASQRMNIIYDATMKARANAERLVGLFEDGGYHSRIIFVDVPIDEAMRRATSRFARRENGRFVDLDYIATHDHKNVASFEAIKPLVDEWEHWDNNVPFGEAPVLMDSGRKG